MPISETAKQNHEQLFPGHTSSLSETDPEFIEIFDNFAFDDVLAHSNLKLHTRQMLILAALIAQQTLSEYRIMAGAALQIGVTPIEIKEILYQTVPYVGIAKAYDFLHTTNAVLTEHGIALPLEGQSTTTSETRMEKGLATQKAIFGDVIDRMYAASPADQTHIQRFLSANCFGDYYTRTGLSIPQRELITFAVIAALGGCEPQLKGHIQGNLNVGNDRSTLLSAVTALIPYIGYPRSLNAIACINAATSG